MKEDRTMRRLRWASLLALIGVILIVWSIFDPTPVPIIVTMSLGQVIGTVSLGLYLLVILPDLRRTVERSGTASDSTSTSGSGSPSASTSVSESGSTSTSPGSQAP